MEDGGRNGGFIPLDRLMREAYFYLTIIGFTRSEN